MANDEIWVVMLRRSAQSWSARNQVFKEDK